MNSTHQTAIKALLLSLALSITPACGYGQARADKFSSALGAGPKQNYNDMLYPYKFKGADYSLHLEWQRLSAKNWLSDVKILLHYAPLYASNSLILVTRHNVNQYLVSADMHYQLGRKIRPLSGANFALFAGGSVDFMACYQILYDTYTAYTFALFDASLGVFLEGRYRVGNLTLSDNLAALLLAGAFYPHYGNANPFTSGGTAASYFVVAPPGKLNRLSNLLKIEFPLFVNRRLRHTFFVGYHFTYEHSTLRDNPVHAVGHSVLVGMVFAIRPYPVK
jgi:hypothetical protein